MYIETYKAVLAIGFGFLSLDGGARGLTKKSGTPKFSGCLGVYMYGAYYIPKKSTSRSNADV